MVRGKGEAYASVIAPTIAFGLIGFFTKFNLFLFIKYP